MNYINNDSTAQYRSLNFLGLLTCAAALLFAVIYLQQRLGLDPCPLCMASRLAILSLGGVFLLAWIHNPRQLGQRFYALLGGLLSASGIALNLRHIWLQNLPKEKVPECGPGLEYLLQNFPLQEVLSTLLSGSGECAEVHWTLIGLTLPQQTLVLFLFLLVIHIIQFRKKRRSYFS
ncbi:MAG: disulfide bond formation protein B [Halopseudomonas sp.]